MCILMVTLDAAGFIGSWSMPSLLFNLLKWRQVDHLMGNKMSYQGKLCSQKFWRDSKKIFLSRGSSKFCLHPVGDTPSSCDPFDTIVSHCVPVIVSDWIELPYEDELDYSKYSVFFSIQEALEPGYMVQNLRQIPKETWIKMWKRLRYIFHHYEFQYPPKREDVVNMLWRQVSHKLPGAKLAKHRHLMSFLFSAS